MQEEELNNTTNKTQMEVSKEETKTHEEVTNINLTSQASYESKLKFN
jgi:hypothetical protein